MHARPDTVSDTYDPTIARSTSWLDTGTPASDGSGAGLDRAEGPSRAGSPPTEEGGKQNAAALIESIGRDFVRLRQDGRSQAWAELEDRLMTAAHELIAAGLLSPKDWIGLAIDIEQFRKQEQGSHVPPGDFLEQWLSTPGECMPVAAVAPAEVVPHKPKRAAKATKKAKVTHEVR